MSDQIMSPDGKHMWTGSEWIPAPPNDNQDLKSNEESDSSNDTKLSSSSEKLSVDGISATNNISDTVIMGDYNIQQNIQQSADIENYMKTMIDAYKELRIERAVEIYELAKKIDYELAISLYNGKYQGEVSKHRSLALMNEIELIKEETKLSEWLDSTEIKLEKLKQREKRCKSLIRNAEELYQFNEKSLDVAELFYEIWKYTPGYLAGGRYTNRLWLSDQFLECGDSQRSQQIVREIGHREEAARDAEVLGIIAGIIGIFILLLMLASL